MVPNPTGRVPLDRTKKLVPDIIAVVIRRYPPGRLKGIRQSRIALSGVMISVKTRLQTKNDNPATMAIGNALTASPTSTPHLPGEKPLRGATRGFRNPWNSRVQKGPRTKPAPHHFRGGSLISLLERGFRAAGRRIGKMGIIPVG
jgi:hypothetical protein